MPAPHTPVLFVNTESGQFGDICTVDGCFPFAQVQIVGPDQFPDLSPAERNEKRQERARHIVHCVNSHDALVEALRAQEDFVKADAELGCYCLELGNTFGLSPEAEQMAEFNRLQAIRDEKLAHAEQLRAAALATQPQP